MVGWFDREIVDTGRLPLFLCFLAFIVTFLTTRAITRTIRAGIGPFRDHVSTGGLHVHHAVPGMVLLVVGAFTAVAVDTGSSWSNLAGVLVGVGTSLVLDEFALIVHLSDVYWAEEGRVSVEMVSLAIASLGLVLLGADPFGGASRADAPYAWLATAVAAVPHLVGIGVCVAKGKYRTALFGAFLPGLSAIGALRLARPGSRWFRRRYAPPKQARALTRAAHHDARWDPVLRRLGDLVAGPATRP